MALGVDAADEFDPPLGAFEQTIALFEQLDALFIVRQRLGQTDFAVFQLADDLLQLHQRLLEAGRTIGLARVSRVSQVFQGSDENEPAAFEDCQPRRCARGGLRRAGLRTER